MKFIAGIAVILLLIGSVFSGGLLVSGNIEGMVQNEECEGDKGPQIENYEGIEKDFSDLVSILKDSVFF